MKVTSHQLHGFIDLLVEAVLREMELEIKNADESGQEQRRREDLADEILSRRPHDITLL